MQRKSDHGFPPSVRLHSNRDYGRVFHRQQKAAGRWLVVLVMPRPKKAAAPRLGIMVGAKAVKTAVRRHQLKRWARECFRLRLKDLLATPGGAHDCVILFRCDLPEGDDVHRRFDQEADSLVRKALAGAANPGQRGRPGGRPGNRPAGPPGGHKAAKPAGPPTSGPLPS